MTSRLAAGSRTAAALLLGVPCAGAMVGGAAEEYRVLALVEVAVLAAGILALVPVLSAAGTRAEAPARDHGRAALCLATFLGVALLQCLLPRPATVPAEGWKLAMGSLAATETTREALKLAAFFVAFVVAGRAAAELRTLAALILPIVLTAAVLSLHGLIGLLFGAPLPPLYPHRAWGYADRLTATYTNPNHFAGMLEMVLPLALAGALVLVRRVDPMHGARTPWRSIRTTVVRFAERPPALAFVGIAVLCGVALVFTRSRLGVASAAAGLLCFALLQGRRPRVGLALAAFAALLVGFLALLGEDPLSGRFTRLDSDVALRLGVWRDVVHGIATRYGITGSGLGTFLFTFPEHQTVFPRAEFAEAHNDYLQLLWEAGLVGAMPAALFLVFVLRGMLRRAGHDRSADAPTRLVAAGAGAAVVSLLVHSVGDFNLQVPANGLLFCICAGVASVGGARTSPSPDALGKVR